MSMLKGTSEIQCEHIFVVAKERTSELGTKILVFEKKTCMILWRVNISVIAVLFIGLKLYEI